MTSLLVEFITNGFGHVFEHHTLLHIQPDHVIYLLQTCKALYAHWRRFVRAYARRKQLTCASCDGAISLPRGPRYCRRMYWTWTTSEPPLDHWRLCDSSDSDVDSDEECEATDTFDQHSLMFHNYDCVGRYSDRRDFLFLEVEGSNDRAYRIRCANMKCYDCRGGIPSFDLSCNQMYPLAALTK